MYKLYSSDDFGETYLPDCEADTFDALRPRMDALDEQYIRWYVEKDGVEMMDVFCAVWAGHLHYVGLNV